MIELRISKKDFDFLKNHLLEKGENEEAALLLVGVCKIPRKLILTVREVIPVPNSGYQTKGSVFLQVDPEFLAPVIKRSRYENASIIIAHSHPFSYTRVGFSGIDDSGEEVLIPKLRQRVPDRPHGALVFGTHSINGRVWVNGENFSRSIDIIRIVGERVEFIPTNGRELENTTFKEMHHRQILALGGECQKIIQKMIVGIVGVGGIGSQVFVQLVHLGVKRLIIIDDELLEESNRSRVIGSRPEDVNQLSKVGIMKRYASDANPDVEVYPVEGPIEHNSVVMNLREANVVFCCTDNVKSRVVVNRLAYQYLTPLIDTGVEIQLGRQARKIRTAAGRVMLIHPDGPCLECMGIISGEALERENAQKLGTRRGTYITGGQHHAPAVVSLNGVIASLAVTHFIDIITGLERDRKPNSYRMYRILNGSVQGYLMEPAVKCTLCREVRGYADDLSLPCILDK